jgi:hypothetical protein
MEKHHDGNDESTMFVNQDKKEGVETDTPEQSGSIFDFITDGGACCACGGGLGGVNGEGAVVTEERDQSSVKESSSMPPQKRNHTWLRSPRPRATGKRGEKDFFE